MTDFDDWRAIHDLKARYCRCLDMKDWQAFAALFVEDVVIDTTASGGPRFEGRDAALVGIRAAIEAAQTAHQVHSPEIEVSGDEATAIWPMQDHLVWPDGRRLTGYGHYHERYVRAEGKWRITESRLTRLSVDISQH